MFRASSAPFIFTPRSNLNEDGVENFKAFDSKRIVTSSKFALPNSILVDVLSTAAYMLSIIPAIAKIFSLSAITKLLDFSIFSAPHRGLKLCISFNKQTFNSFP